MPLGKPRSKWKDNIKIDHKVFVNGGINVKVKAVCGSYSTAALRHIVLLPE